MDGTACDDAHHTACLDKDKMAYTAYQRKVDVCLPFIKAKVDSVSILADYRWLVASLLCFFLVLRNDSLVS